MIREIEEKFPIEVQNKLKELREKRNEYYNKSQDVQKEIDSVIIENYGINEKDYENQYFEYRDGEALYYGKIRSVERTYRGIKVNTLRHTMLTSDMDLHFYNDGDIIFININNITSLKIIEPSYYQNEIERMRKVII